MKTAVLAAVAIITAGCAQSAPAATPVVLYVSPSGSDANAGTAAKPLRTPQVAVNKLPQTGGIVQLAAGTYAKQRIVVSGRKNITVRAAAGARPVLDATGLVPADDRSGVVQIQNSSRITVDGLTVTGYRTTSLSKVPIGIYVTGSGTSITVIRSRVTKLGNDNATKGSMEMNAHGIAVYADNPAAGLTDVHVDGNEVDNLKLGASEAVVVNGNVNGWTVSKNFVHDNNNIGIDAIGYEDVTDGANRYDANNRARNGVVDGNTVTGISAKGNPAYYEDGEYCGCADGIYVDGGAGIKITGNRVSAADIGVEVAAEDPRGKTNDVTVSGNTITGSRFVGLTVGGYAANRGEAYNLTVTGNTLRGNTTRGSGSPELLLQYKVHDSTFTANKITSTDAGDPVLVLRVPGSLTDTKNKFVVFDRNDYGAPVAAGDAEFGWFSNDATTTGFAAWQQKSKQDAHSTYTRR